MACSACCCDVLLRASLRANSRPFRICFVFRNPTRQLLTERALHLLNRVDLSFGQCVERAAIANEPPSGVCSPSAEAESFGRLCLCLVLTLGSRWPSVRLRTEKFHAGWCLRPSGVSAIRTKLSNDRLWQATARCGRLSQRVVCIALQRPFNVCSHEPFGVAEAMSYARNLCFIEPASVIANLPGRTTIPDNGVLEPKGHI
jgi:hypothetical protein